MPAIPAAIQNATADYPDAAKAVFGKIRDMIFDEAERLRTGPLEETLKWGEPAYMTPVTKSGSTIRMAWKPSDPDNCNIYPDCVETLGFPRGGSGVILEHGTYHWNIPRADAAFARKPR